MDVEAVEADTEWRAYVRRENLPLWRSIEARGYRTTNLEREVGHATPLTVKLTGETLYADPDCIGRRADQVAERVEADLDYFHEVAADCRETCEAFLDACEEIASGTPPAERSDDRLLDQFRTYVDHNTDVVAYRELVFFLDEILADLLDEATAGADVEFTPDMAVPSEDLPFVAERRDLLELGRAVETDASAREAFTVESPAAVLDRLPDPYRERIEAHADAYGWVTTARYTGDPLTAEGVVENLRPLLGECEERLADLDADRAEKRARLDDLSGDERLDDLVEIAREYAFLRTYRMDVVFEGDYRLRPFLEAIAARGGFDYAELLHLTVPEVEDVLRGRPPSRRTVAARRRAYAVYLVDDEIAVVEGDRAVGLVGEPDDEAGEKPDPATPDELTGRVAQPGTVAGPATVVSTADDVDRVDEGDVLVSPMTTPDMVVALHDVAGIVTDEGGMASHAAIISREFGIPCVIGTGTATTAVRDGDRVEIDADGDEGVVRIRR